MRAACIQISEALRKSGRVSQSSSHKNVVQVVKTCKLTVKFQTIAARTDAKSHYGKFYLLLTNAVIILLCQQYAQFYFRLLSTRP